jgi:hypothetical protein
MPQLVRPQGGAYFYVPSLAWIWKHAAGAP